MWFKFPLGVERISVERQQFESEARDADGADYFRAPEHFAPVILAMKGFAVVDVPPADAPADLPKVDPLRDNAIAALTAAQEAQKIEMQNLRTDYGAAKAKVTALDAEKTALAQQLHEATVRLTQFEEEAEEREEGTSLLGAEKK